MGTIKKDGGYILNGAYPHEKYKALMESHSNLLTRKNIALLLILLCIGSPVTARVFAALFQPPPAPPPPTPIGYFTVTVEVNDAVDVYGWQVAIRFDPEELQYVDVSPGDFLEEVGNLVYNLTEDGQGGLFSSKAMFLYSIDNDVLLIGQTLIGSELERSGSGILATIKYGYYHENYKPPELIDEATYLANSNADFVDGTIELKP